MSQHSDTETSPSQSEISYIGNKQYKPAFVASPEILTTDSNPRPRHIIQSDPKIIQPQRIIHDDSRTMRDNSRVIQDNSYHLDDSHSSNVIRRYITTITGANKIFPSKVEVIQKLTKNTSTLQWSEFSGVIAASNLEYTQFNVEIDGLPRNQLVFITGMLYNGQYRDCLIEVNTASMNGVRFYFNTDRTGMSIEIGDSFKVFGSCINWLR